MPKLSIWSKSRRRLGLLALLLCVGACVRARAEGRDVVEFGNDIVVHDGEEAHDTVCFLCSIEVDGTVHGDMVAFLGNIHVRGHAERDAVVFLGNITLGENASIGRDVVVFAGSLHNAPGSSIGNDRVIFPVFLLFMPLLVFAGIIFLIVWAIRALVYRDRPVYPMPPPRY
jgi:acetyltransferase-like isoleucine patch superfamily enzyme